MRKQPNRRSRYITTERQRETNSRTCGRCKTTKPLDQFGTFTRKGHLFYRSYCKPCLSEYVKSLPKKEPTSTWHKHRSDLTMKYRKQAIEKGLCTHCRTRPSVDGILTCEVCRMKDLIKAKTANEKNRRICLEHYGMKCQCCGEYREPLLTLDHIGGWGTDHRTPAGYKYSGAPLYRWLIRNNFPEGFQVLCYNCNCSRAHSGRCPHQDERSLPDISYPGQEYFHNTNPNIAKAELNWQSQHSNPSSCPEIAYSAIEAA